MLTIIPYLIDARTKKNNNKKNLPKQPLIPAEILLLYRLAGTHVPVLSLLALLWTLPSVSVWYLCEVMDPKLNKIKLQFPLKLMINKTDGMLSIPIIKRLEILSISVKKNVVRQFQN